MKKTILKISYFILSLSIILTSIAFTSQAEDIEKQYCNAILDDSFTDNEIIIITMPFADNYSYSNESFSNIGCTQIEELSYNVVENKLSRIIKLTLLNHSKQNVLDSIRLLEERSDIYSAEPNYTGSFEMSSQDPYYVNNEQWAINNINLPAAWEVTNSYSSTILVGVIDSGIDVTHPDLSGKVDTTLSKCFTSAYSTALEDEVGHGTHVAGIIGAGINNKNSNNQYIGMAGTSPNAKLVSLRVDNELHEPDIDAIITAISYASIRNIPILNCSIGMHINYDQIESLKLAIELYDGLLICAAGNNGVNNNVYRIYPSDMNYLSNVISVGASDENDLVCNFSNYGATSVDLFAPGANILSTVSSAVCSSTCDTEDHYALKYHKWNGTSMAAPYVTGVAALMLSANPNLQAHQIKDIILRSVDVVPALYDLCITGGRLNAYKAVHTARMIYLGCEVSYSPLSVNTHTVYFDICSECSCDTYNGACNNCDMCDPCENCHISYTELHNYRVIDYDSTFHELICDDCDATYQTPHQLYVLYEEENQIIVRCKWCPYTHYCNHYTYSNIDHTYHNVNCTVCGYSINEDHQLKAIFIDNNANFHNVVCLDCGYNYNEGHTWAYSPEYNKLQCTGCGCILILE